MTKGETNRLIDRKNAVRGKKEKQEGSLEGREGKEGSSLVGGSSA